MDPGDRVKVFYEEKELEGILMPRPEVLEKGIIIIKLDNGYNIGLDEKKIKKTEVIEKYKEPKVETTKLKQNKDLKNVTIISTGGTISSRIDYRTGGVYADYTAEDFVQMMPELAKTANLKAKKIMATMSEDFTPTQWIKIAEEVTKELNNGADGVVITQGTDTLHYTAAALSFFLRDLNKPVILTASQRSIDRGSSDAFQNVTAAVTAAAKSKIAEVMICMHGSENDDYCYLLRGTKVRKMHNTRRDAFRPINELPLAKVLRNGKIEYLNTYNETKTGKIKIESTFESRIGLILIHPGLEPDILDFYLEKGYKGIVLASYALGHLPVSDQKFSLLPFLRKAKEKNIPIIITSQTIYGRTHPYVYTNLRKLSIGSDCIFAEDILPETAYVKLGWILGKTTDKEEVRKLMQTNIAGEISERSLPKTFLL